MPGSPAGRLPSLTPGVYKLPPSLANVCQQNHQASAASSSQAVQFRSIKLIRLVIATQPKRRSAGLPAAEVYDVGVKRILNCWIPIPKTQSYHLLIRSDKQLPLAPSA